MEQLFTYVLKNITIHWKQSHVFELVDKNEVTCIEMENCADYYALPIYCISGTN